MVNISRYNHEWVEDFNRLKNIYISNIKDVKFKVEHVGSTSVPGLCAKPIIDISLSYYNIDDFRMIKIKLESLGYNYKGDLGITDREAFKYVGDEDLPNHHLYVCLEGTLALKNLILFRDYLLTHKDVAIEYSQLKIQLANKYERDVYCFKKTKFITGILRKCGLSEEEVDKIIKMNET